MLLTEATHHSQFIGKTKDSLSTVSEVINHKRYTSPTTAYRRLITSKDSVSFMHTVTGYCWFSDDQFAHAVI